MSDVMTAFWSMTINNPDETSLALVQQGYPDYMRELVYTHEQGKEGTPHIQAWLKLQRQQRLSFVKKLFPRGHFKPLCSAEYIENTKRYAQKNDETTRSASVHQFHDPILTVESVVKRVALRVLNDTGPRMRPKGFKPSDYDMLRRIVEREMVTEDYKYAKQFVSATYKSMWKQFAAEMIECMLNKQQQEEEARVDIPTHTHTHTQGEKIISPKRHNNAAEGEDSSQSQGSDSQEYTEGEEDGEGDDNGSGFTDEDYSEGFSHGFSEASDKSWS